jgi:outer membrane protein assembly factor BamB
MKNNLSILVLCIFFQCCTSNPVEISQWRGPNRDGIYPEKNLLKEWPENGPELAWNYDKIGIGYSSATVTSEKVFINGIIDSIGYLFAFEHTGQLVYKKEYGPDWTVNFPGTRTSPSFYDGMIYLLTGYGQLYCLKAEDGTVVWTKNILKEFNGVNPEQGITENLIIDGNKLFCAPGGVENNIVALNRLTGELIWVSKGNSEKSAFCSPILINHNDKKFYITMTAKSLISVDAENGNVAWRYGDLIFQYPEHPNTPIYKDGYLFAIDGANGGSVKLKLSDNGLSYEVIWKSNIIDQVLGNAVLVNDKLYSYSNNKKKWYSNDWVTGEGLFTMDTLTEGSIIFSDGLFYCYAFSGEIALIKSTENSLELISAFKIPGQKRDHWAHPVIKDGKLYIRYHDNLWVYNIKK